MEVENKYDKNGWTENSILQEKEREKGERHIYSS